MMKRNSSRISWDRSVSLIFGVMITLLSPAAVLATSSGGTIYGPQRFNRTTGAPNYYSVTFSAPGWAQAPYVLRVENGGASGEDRVSSAWIEVNNDDVVDPSDLNQNVGAIQRSVSLGKQNRLEVKLAGRPGSYITIRISAGSKDTIPPVVGIISPANGSVIRLATPDIHISYTDPTPACQEHSGYHHGSYPHRDERGRVRRGHFHGDGCEDGDDEWRDPHRDDSGRVRSGHYENDRCKGGKDKWQDPHWDDHGRLRHGHYDGDRCHPDCDPASGLDLDTLVVLLDGVDRTAWFTKRSGDATATVPQSAALSTGGHRLEVSVADEAGNIGRAVSVFSVDFASPQLHILQPASSSYLAAKAVAVVVQLSDMSGIDPSTLRMLVNGEDKSSALSLTSTGATATIGPLPEGANTVSVSVTDLAGNPVSDSVTFNVDTTAPAISIIQPVSGSRHGSGSLPISVQFSDAQALKLETLNVSLDGVPVPVVVNGNIATGQLEAPADGTHTITATISDKAGNAGVATPSSFEIDTAAPTITIPTPPAGSLLNTRTPSIVVDYSDNGQVDPSTVKITLNGEDRTQSFDVQATSATSSSLTLDDGVVSITAQVKDLVGNTGTVSSSFTIDTAPPVAHFEGPAPVSNDSQPRVTLRYSDTGSQVDLDSVHILLDGVDVTASFSKGSAAASGVLSGLADGNYTLTATLSDVAGNTASQPALSFQVDTLPPEVMVESPANDSFTNQRSPAVAIRYSDAASRPDVNSVRVLLTREGSTPVDVTSFLERSETAATGVIPASTELVDGTYELAVEVKDIAGNGTIRKAAFELDTVAPTYSIQAPTAGFLNSSMIPVSIGYDDDRSGIDRGRTRVTVDGTDYTSQLTVNASEATGTLDIPPASAHRFEVNVFDRAGNAGIGNGPIEVLIDALPPVILAAISPEPSPAGWYKQGVNIVFSCSDQGGSGIASCPAPVALDSEGPGQQVNVTATDNAGNQTSWSQDFNIDRTSPSITAVVAPPVGPTGWHNTDVTVTFLCADGISGVESCPTPILVTTEGAAQKFGGTVTDRAGNTASATIEVSVAKTPPTITAVIQPAPNANGWNNSDVAVSFNCSSASGIAVTCPPPQSLTLEGENQTISGTAVDVAGNSSSTSVRVSIDKTAPTIASSVAPPPTADGWNNTDVTVSYACSDALSGVPSCPGPQIVTTDGPQQQISGTVSDRAGNTATAVQSVSIDKGIPGIVAELMPPPNSAGWNSSDVTVSFLCTSSLSGIASCSSPVVLSTEGAGQSVSGTVITRSGQSASASVVVNIDKTKPLVTAVLDPQPNTAGWNNTDVGVRFDCRDTVSTIALCPSPLEFRMEGAAQTATAIATDAAGNQETASVTVNLDKTAPTVTVTASPRANGAGWNNTDVTVTFSCSDALSGVTSCPSSTTVSTEGADQPVSGTAVDQAGNTSQPATISLSIQKSAPTIELTAPAQLIAGQSATVSAAVVHPIPVSHVSFTVNGVLAGTASVPPYQAVISAPAGAVAGENLIVTAQAVDIAGNTAVANRGIKIIAQGVLAGQVLSDVTGLPLKGARVQLLGGAALNDTSDNRGRYSIPISDTRAILRAVKDADPSEDIPEMVAVERAVDVQPSVGTVPVDMRLTPLAPPVTLAGDGGILSAGVPQGPGVTVMVPSGILESATAFHLTMLSGQGLPNLLPLGWSPVAAFDLRADSGFTTITTAHFTGLPNLPLQLVTYNPTLHAWFMVTPNLGVDSDGSLSVSLPALASYALITADLSTPPLPVPEPEQPLTGVAWADVPAGTTSSGSLNPPVLPASGGISEATLNVQLPSTVPSGTVVQSVVSESYALRSGSNVSEEKRLQDLILYQSSASAGSLSARFPVSPSRTFKVAELASGKVHLDILAGREGVRGQMGGHNSVVVQADNGTASITIAGGSLVNDAPLALYAGTVDPYLPSGGTFAPLASYILDLSGESLGSTAQLSAAIASSVSPADTLFVAKVIRLNGVPRLSVVSMAQVSGTNVVSVPHAGLKGIVEEGEYVFYRSSLPLAFVSGTTTANSQPVGAIVETDSLPFISPADEQGRFIVAVLSGNVDLNAFVLNTSMVGSGSTQAVAGETATLDIELSGAITTATVTPADGALQVPVTTQITVTTSQPVDIGTISASSIKLYRGPISNNQPVAVHFVTLAGASGLAVIPDQALAPGATYTFAASGVTDLFGAYVSVPVVSFTTKSDTPPVFDPTQIVFSFPDENGIVRVTAPAGSLPPGTHILIIDLTSGLVVSFTVGNDGSLSGDFPATINDVLQITVTDPNGGTTTFTRSQFVREDGTVAVGPGGGIVAGPGGVELRIPPGALERGTEFKLEAFGPELFSERPELTGATFGGGLKITVAEGVTLKKEAKLAFPKPADAPDGSFFYVYRLLNGPDNIRAFETLDHAFVEPGSGKVVTASYPLAGLIQTASNFISLAASRNYQAAFGDPLLGNYAFLMWTYEQLRPGLASSGAITGKVQYAVPPGTKDRNGVLNTSQETIYKPIAGAAVSRVDENGYPTTSNSRDQDVAISQPDGTFTMFDERYAGGPVHLSAVADGVAPSTVIGKGYEATAATDKTAQEQSGPLLKYYRNVAYVPIAFPAQAPPPPAPRITIKLLKADPDEPSKKVDAGGMIVAGTPLQIVVESRSKIQTVSIDGVALSIPSSEGPTPPNGIYSIPHDYTTIQTGSHSVDATVLDSVGTVVYETRRFLIIAAGAGDKAEVIPGAAPIINRAVPDVDAEGVDVGVFPSIEFSEPVKVVPDSVRLEAEDGSRASLRFRGYGCIGGVLPSGECKLKPIENVGASDGIVSLTIEPIGGLRYGTRYKIVFTDAVKDFDDVIDPTHQEPARSLLAEYRQRYSFKTYGPETLGGTTSFSSTRAVILGDRAYLARRSGTGTSYMETYDISDPSSPTLLSTGGQMVGLALDIAAEENVPAIGGNMVAVAHSVGGTEFDLPSNLTLYDVSSDKPVRRGIVSVSSSSRVGGIVTRVVMKGNRAYTTILQQGLQVVDLDKAVFLYDNAGPFELGSAATPGVGFANEAVINVIPVRDAKEQNVRLADIKVGDFLGSGEVLRRLVVGTGAVAGNPPSTISFVVADPAGLGGGAIQYAGNPQSEVGSLTSGQALALGKVPDPHASQSEKEAAVVIGFGTVSGGSVVPVLVVIDLTNPFSPALMGSVSLKGSPIDIVLYQKTAIVSTSSGIELYNLSDPTAPTYAGTIEGGTLGDRLAITEDGVAVATSFDQSRGGVRTMPLGSYVAVLGTSPALIPMRADGTTATDVEVRYRVQVAGEPLKDGNLTIEDGDQKRATIVVSDLSPGEHKITLPAGLRLSEQPQSVEVAVVMPDGTRSNSVVASVLNASAPPPVLIADGGMGGTGGASGAELTSMVPTHGFANVGERIITVTGSGLRERSTIYIRDLAGTWNEVPFSATTDSTGTLILPADLMATPGFLQLSCTPDETQSLAFLVADPDLPRFEGSGEAGASVSAVSLSPGPSSPMEVTVYGGPFSQGMQIVLGRGDVPGIRIPTTLVDEATMHAALIRFAGKGADLVVSVLSSDGSTLSSPVWVQTDQTSGGNASEVVSETDTIRYTDPAVSFPEGSIKITSIDSSFSLTPVSSLQDETAEETLSVKGVNLTDGMTLEISSFKGSQQVKELVPLTGVHQYDPAGPDITGVSVLALAGTASSPGQQAAPNKNVVGTAKTKNLATKHTRKTAKIEATKENSGKKVTSTKQVSVVVQGAGIPFGGYLRLQVIEDNDGLVSIYVPDLDGAIPQNAKKVSVEKKHLNDGQGGRSYIRFESDPDPDKQTVRVRGTRLTLAPPSNDPSKRMPVDPEQPAGPFRQPVVVQYSRSGAAGACPSKPSKDLACRTFEVVYRRLGFANNSRDLEILRVADRYGIPPQFLRSQAQTETNLFTSNFRYEPSTQDFSLYSGDTPTHAIGGTYKEYLIAYALPGDGVVPNGKQKFTCGLKVQTCSGTPVSGTATSYSLNTGPIKRGTTTTYPRWKPGTREELCYRPYGKGGSVARPQCSVTATLEQFDKDDNLVQSTPLQLVRGETAFRPRCGKSTTPCLLSAVNMPLAENEFSADYRQGTITLWRAVGPRERLTVYYHQLHKQGRYVKGAALSSHAVDLNDQGLVRQDRIKGVPKLPRYQVAGGGPQSLSHWFEDNLSWVGTSFLTGTDSDREVEFQVDTAGKPTRPRDQRYEYATAQPFMSSSYGVIQVLPGEWTNGAKGAALRRIRDISDPQQSLFGLLSDFSEGLHLGTALIDALTRGGTEGICANCGDEATFQHTYRDVYRSYNSSGPEYKSCKPKEEQGEPIFCTLAKDRANSPLIEQAVQCYTPSMREDPSNVPSACH